MFWFANDVTGLGLVCLLYRGVTSSQDAAQKDAGGSLPKKRPAPLQKKRDFLELRTNGRNWYCAFFKVRYLVTDCEQGLSKVAIVISKKVSKRAVVRNRIRRRLRAAFVEAFQTLKSPSCHMSITPRLACMNEPFTSLADQCRRALTYIAANNLEGQHASFHYVSSTPKRERANSRGSGT